MIVCFHCFHILHQMLMLWIFTVSKKKNSTFPKDQTQRSDDFPHRSSSPVHQHNASLYSRREESICQATENSIYQKTESPYHGGGNLYQERYYKYFVS